MTGRRVQSFRQIDVKRALEGARKAGLVVAACALGPNGQIKLVFRDNAGGAPTSSNEWDDVLG